MVTVTIGAKTWVVEVASTSAQITQGLSGRASLLPYNGMLFDLGSPQASITIKMSAMLFGLGIVFISEDHKIVGLGTALAGAPNETITFLSGHYPRYFLEFNASEFAGMAQGDSVVISGYTPTTTSSIISLMVTMMIVVMMMQMMAKTMKEIK